MILLLYKNGPNENVYSLLQVTMKIFLIVSIIVAAAFAQQSEDVGESDFLRPIFPDGRIVGGEDADISDFQYQVYIFGR